MNSVKIAYLVCITISEIVFIAMAILVHVYDVPGAGWWTAFLIFILFGASQGCTKRMDSWENFGDDDK